MDERPELPRPRRTKIIATLGPASYDRIPELIEAGVDCFRLNCSHGHHDEYAAAIARVRQAATAFGRHIGILADLQGPRIRTTRSGDGEFSLVENSLLTVSGSDADEPSFSHHVRLCPAAAVAGLSIGSHILLADGRVDLEVVVRDFAGTWRCTVRRGGVVGDRQGVNLRATTNQALTALTEKDRADIRWGIASGVDLFALSFVRDAEDVATAQAAIAELGADAPVVAKLERAEALAYADGILHQAFGVMVARGDLAVGLGLAVLPVLQKRLIADARTLGRPVITATEMLQSMVHAPVPTRAEVSDVANAVFDGTDAVMLSAETSVGEYPIEVVRVMRDVILAAERDPSCHRAHAALGRPRVEFVDAIGELACLGAERAGAAAIVVYTQNGQAALRIAAHRPPVPIYAFSERCDTLRRLSLVWGVLPRALEAPPSPGDDFIPASEAILRSEGALRPGDRVAITSKTFHAEGNGWTSCLILHEVT